MQELKLWMQRRLRRDRISVNLTVAKCYQLALVHTVGLSDHCREDVLETAYSHMFKRVKTLQLLNIERVKVKMADHSRYVFMLYYAPIDRQHVCDCTVVPRCASTWWYSRHTNKDTAFHAYNTCCTEFKQTSILGH